MKHSQTPIHAINIQRKQNPRKNCSQIDDSNAGIDGQDTGVEIRVTNQPTRHAITAVLYARSPIATPPGIPAKNEKLHGRNTVQNLTAAMVTDSIIARNI
jgi:hypothetical protein